MGSASSILTQKVWNPAMAGMYVHAFINNTLYPLSANTLYPLSAIESYVFLNVAVHDVIHYIIPVQL